LRQPEPDETVQPVRTRTARSWCCSSWGSPSAATRGLRTAGRLPRRCTDGLWKPAHLTRSGRGAQCRLDVHALLLLALSGDDSEQLVVSFDPVCHRASVLCVLLAVVVVVEGAAHGPPIPATAAFRPIPATARPIPATAARFSPGHYRPGRPPLPIRFRPPPSLFSPDRRQCVVRHKVMV
jgi:hypothetical protein